MIELEFKTETITAKDLLKVLNIAQSGGEAKYLIKNFGLSINKEKIYIPGKKLSRGDRVVFENYKINLI